MHSPALNSSDNFALTNRQQFPYIAFSSSAGEAVLLAKASALEPRLFFARPSIGREQSSKHGFLSGARFHSRYGLSDQPLGRTALSFAKPRISRRLPVPDASISPGLVRGKVLVKFRCICPAILRCFPDRTFWKRNAVNILVNNLDRPILVKQPLQNPGAFDALSLKQKGQVIII